MVTSHAAMVPELSEFRRIQDEFRDEIEFRDELRCMNTTGISIFFPLFYLTVK